MARAIKKYTKVHALFIFEKPQMQLFVKKDIFEWIYTICILACERKGQFFFLKTTNVTVLLENQHFTWDFAINIF